MKRKKMVTDKLNNEEVERTREQHRLGINLGMIM